MEQEIKKSTVEFTGKLREQIEQKAEESGLTFEEFVKAGMSIYINSKED